MGPVLCCFLLCGDVRKDGGTFNIDGVFYRVQSLSFPASHSCSVIIGWYGAEGYYDFGLKYLGPDRSQVLLEVPFYPFTLTRERPYYNAVIKTVLPLTGAGVHWFEIYQGGRRQAEFPLQVLPAGPARIIS